MYPPSIKEKVDESDVIFTGIIKDFSCPSREQSYVEFSPVKIYRDNHRLQHEVPHYSLITYWPCKSFSRGDTYLVYGKYTSQKEITPATNSCPGSLMQIRPRYRDWLEYQYFMIMKLHEVHLFWDLPNPKDDIDYLEKTMQTNPYE